ncbi:hypothetical protein JNUCC0626_03775 [Lentzea sp. JNUCC 0626]|uniref:hypothetical protein n=1 Tax=Lentzea sp. JNUCC 0626 TaxID=3367513 RepID=UPI0037490B24
MQPGEEGPSPAGRMGKAAEHLAAATCILTSRGKLNVATPLVDDEGIDLLFNSIGGDAVPAVQVKARMSTGKRLKSKTFVAFVRTQTFRQRKALDLLFVAIDVDNGVGHARPFSVLRLHEGHRTRPLAGVQAHPGRTRAAAARTPAGARPLRLING